jgi:hemerythrin-like domain-containing protein
MSASDPTAPLSLEHREIDRVLVAISLVLARSDPATLDLPFVAQVVDFIERFADGSHHEKEEKILFAEVLTKATKLSAPVSCMLHQHEHGRDLTRAVRAWVTGPRSLREAYVPDVRAVLERYVTLLWNHVATEDLVVFPAIKSVLSPRSAARVLERYREAALPSHQVLCAAANSVVAAARLALASHDDDGVAGAPTASSC